MATKNRITPAATSMYNFLKQPKTKFKKEGTYDTTLLFDEDHPFVKELRDEAHAAHEEFIKGLKPAERKTCYYVDPVSAVKDEEGKETGQVAVHFKSNAQFKDKKTGEIVPITMKVYDAGGKTPMKNIPNIGNGSVLKVAFNASAYQMAGEDRRTKEKFTDCGISLWLNAVQIIELVEYGGGAGFGEEEGYKADSSAFESRGEGAPVEDELGEDAKSEF